MKCGGVILEYHLPGVVCHICKNETVTEIDIDMDDYYLLECTTCGDKRFVHHALMDFIY